MIFLKTFHFCNLRSACFFSPSVIPPQGSHKTNPRILITYISPLQHHSSSLLSKNFITLHSWQLIMLIWIRCVLSSDATGGLCTSRRIFAFTLFGGIVMFYCENVTEWEQEPFSRLRNARHLIAGLDLCIVCVFRVPVVLFTCTLPTTRL